MEVKNNCNYSYGLKTNKQTKDNDSLYKVIKKPDMHEAYCSASAFFLRAVNKRNQYQEKHFVCKQTFISIHQISVCLVNRL